MSNTKRSVYKKRKIFRLRVKTVCGMRPVEFWKQQELNDRARKIPDLLEICFKIKNNILQLLRLHIHVMLERIIVDSKTTFHNWKETPLGSIYAGELGIVLDKEDYDVFNGAMILLLSLCSEILSRNDVKLYSSRLLFQIEHSDCEVDHVDYFLDYANFLNIGFHIVGTRRSKLLLQHIVATIVGCSWKEDTSFYISKHVISFRKKIFEREFKFFGEKIYFVFFY